jgi:hypothetical protein
MYATAALQLPDGVLLCATLCAAAAVTDGTHRGVAAWKLLLLLLHSALTDEQHQAAQLCGCCCSWRCQVALPGRVPAACLRS